MKKYLAFEVNLPITVTTTDLCCDCNTFKPNEYTTTCKQCFNRCHISCTGSFLNLVKDVILT